MSTQILTHKQPITLECGVTLPEVDIAYTTFGEMNADKSNVVWICHAFSANSNPVEWWPGMVGEGLFLDPEKIFHCLCQYAGILLWNNRSIISKS
jgi:homoserine O-acetyltransferase